MPLPILTFPPIQTGYAVDFSDASVEVALEGGSSRKRKDLMDPSNSVTLQWLLTAVEYTRFMGFFTTTLRYGRDSFIIDLVSDIGIPTPHEAIVAGGLPRLQRQSGEGYFVSGTFEVKQNPTYSGNIVYLEEGQISINVISPRLGQLIVAGDTVDVLFSNGIHPIGSTPLNLDGRYLVDSTSGNVLILDDPHLVNSGWTTLAGLGVSVEYGSVANGNVLSTIYRVPS